MAIVCLRTVSMTIEKVGLSPNPARCHAPYLASVRARIEVRVGLDWTGRLSVKQTVQYLDLLRREQLPSHLLPEEVPPAVTVSVSQRRLLQT